MKPETDDNKMAENKTLISKINKNKAKDFKRVKSAVGFNSTIFRPNL